jgi:hypothetical protein
MILSFEVLACGNCLGFVAAERFFPYQACISAQAHLMEGGKGVKSNILGERRASGSISRIRVSIPSYLGQLEPN